MFVSAVQDRGEDAKGHSSGVSRFPGAGIGAFFEIGDGRMAKAPARALRELGLRDSQFPSAFADEFG